jgi:ABC-type polysaccharide/polyol phosphate export permease
VNSLREIVRYRDLLYMMTWRDISIKYKQSILGLCWALLMPAVIVLAGIIVKLAMAKVSGTTLQSADLARVSVKAVPWAFFVASLRFGTNCLVGNANLVTKIYFPKVIFPLAAVASQLFDFLIATCVLALLLAVMGGLNVGAAVLWLPLLLLLLVMFACGLSILFSAAGLFFRDVKYLVEIILTFAIFFTPIFYEVSTFGEWQTLLLLNPVAPIFEAITDVTVNGRAPDLMWLGYSAIVSVVIFCGSVAFFRRVEPAFAECI